MRTDLGGDRLMRGLPGPLWAPEAAPEPEADVPAREIVADVLAIPPGLAEEQLDRARRAGGGLDVAHFRLALEARVSRTTCARCGREVAWFRIGDESYIADCLIKYPGRPGMGLDVHRCEDGGG